MGSCGKKNNKKIFLNLRLSKIYNYLHLLKFANRSTNLPSYVACNRSIAVYHPSDQFILLVQMFHNTSSFPLIKIYASLLYFWTPLMPACERRRFSGFHFFPPESDLLLFRSFSHRESDTFCVCHRAPTYQFSFSNGT